MVIWHPQPGELRETGTWDKKVTAHGQLCSRVSSCLQSQRGPPLLLLRPSHLHSPRSLWNWSINSSKTRQSSKPWEENYRVNRQREQHVHEKCSHGYFASVAVHTCRVPTEHTFRAEALLQATLPGVLQRNPGGCLSRQHGAALLDHPPMQSSAPWEGGNTSPSPLLP